jgi:hypothetical protein
MSLACFLRHDNATKNHCNDFPFRFFLFSCRPQNDTMQSGGEKPVELIGFTIAESRHVTYCQCNLSMYSEIIDKKLLTFDFHCLGTKKTSLFCQHAVCGILAAFMTLSSSSVDTKMLFVYRRSSWISENLIVNLYNRLSRKLNGVQIDIQAAFLGGFN